MMQGNPHHYEYGMAVLKLLRTSTKVEEGQVP